MPEPRLQRIRELFTAALARPAAQREAFLSEACGGDQELRREVDSLLAAPDEAGGFFAEPAHPATAPTVARSSEHLRPGTRLGPYEVVSFVSAGGMGEVYKARDTRLDRTVAVKLLPSHVAVAPQARERFHREARAIAALNHQNICTLYDVGEAPSPDPGSSEPIRFLVMEYVEGTTLAHAGELPLEPARVAGIAAQISDALAAAHARGIVHRDVKPLNVMVTPQGQVKVLDFGVAKLDPRADEPLEREPAGVRTGTGVLMGTLPYMSPEQACGGSVTPATDIFSLGVVLYQLMTGRHPFVPVEPHAHLQALLHALLAQTPLPPNRHNAAVPPAIGDVILRMLEKDPALRPDAAEVRRVMLDPQTLAGASSAQAVGQARRHLVGRQRERALLQQAFAEAVAGRPLLVTVSGEPGIGKTTLVEDFLGDLRSTGDAYIARGRCSERLAGSEAYLPVLEALESLLTGDDRFSGAQQLMLRVAPTWYAQVAPAGQGPSTGVGAQLELKTASQERMKRELRAFLDEVSRTRPLALFVDDLHWSDVSTVDLLGYLCSQFGSMRVLIVATYRPTDLLLAKHPFAALRLDLTARGLCHEVPLGFLSRDEAAHYLALKYPGHRFPSAFTALIHEKTEGSPLFMVDLVRDLQDSQVIVPRESGWTLAQSIPVIESDLPESIRSMIERKIAQLADDDRQLLVCASVQGHSFDSAVVAKVLGRDAAEVEDRLEVLNRVHAFVNVLREDALPNGTPTLRCRFVHVLYQNTLYASLRATRRMSLSTAVANALIEFHGPADAGIASELAVLLEAAHDRARASGYFLVACQNALRVFAFVEAAAIAERGLGLLSGLPETPERNAVELKLQVALGTAWVAIKGYAAPDVERAYGRARELCRQLGDSQELASVLFGLFVYYVVVPSHRTSLELGDEMLAIADRTDDAALRVQGLLTHGMTRFWMGDVEIGTAQLEEGITLYEEQRRALYGKTPLFDHGVGCRRYQAVSLWLLGFPDKAARRAEEAVVDARGSKHPLTLASTLGFVSMLHYFRRDIGATAETSAEAVACTREYVLTFWLGFSSALHGWAIAQLAASQGPTSSWEEGVAQIRESLEAHREAGARTFSTFGRALLAEAYMLRERFDEAGQSLDEGLELARDASEGVWEAELHRLRGERLRRLGRGDDAEGQFEQAVAVAHGRRQRSLELRALTSLFRLVRSRSCSERADDVRTSLAQACDWFTEGLDSVDLRQAHALLAGEPDS